MFNFLVDIKGFIRHEMKMVVFIFILFVTNHMVYGTFTTNPPAMGSSCTGDDRQITWQYTSLNGIIVVQWKKGVRVIMEWDPDSNAINYGQGFSAANISHDNSNGQITLINVDTSFTGEYSCEYIDSVGDTFTSGQLNLQVYDLLNTVMNCSCNTKEIRCNLADSVSGVTINNTVEHLPFEPTVIGSYIICMTGGQINCLANNVPTCETVELCPSGTDNEMENGCNDHLIYTVYFLTIIAFVTLTFSIVVLLIRIFRWKLKCFGLKGLIIVIAMMVDVVFEFTMLFGVLYASNFENFESGRDCNVTVINLVSLLVALVVIEPFKVFLLYKCMEKIRELIAECCRDNNEEMESDVEGRPLKHHAKNEITPASSGLQVAPRDHGSVKPEATHSTSIISPDDSGGHVARRDHGIVKPMKLDANSDISGQEAPRGSNNESVASPENIMFLLHFSMPFGYTFDRWVNEENTSLDKNERYVTNERGTLHIKAATERDNGIYQSILKSGDESEQRLNVVLHVTGRRSVSLIVNPSVWVQIRNKRLKQIFDLKEISGHISTKNVANIPSNLKKNEEICLSVASVQWTHNGKQILSPVTSSTSDVPPLPVQMKIPMNEYHCTVEFSNKKSHLYIFIVKFTGGRASTNIDEVVGVPTIINTRRGKDQEQGDND